jgi:hypothetical protein
MKRKKHMPAMSDTELLKGVSVRLLCKSERELYDKLLDEQHYLKSGQLVGEQLRYVAECNGQWLALLSWSAGSFHLADRDKWIGWTAQQRQCRLPFVVNNSRFLVLKDVECPNLASRILKLCLDRLSSDWLDAYAHGVLLAESFVDPELFRGTAYRASGWELLGQTRGYSRVRAEYYTEHDRPKHLYVKALRPDACELLRSDVMPDACRCGELPPKVRCTTRSAELKTIGEHFKALKDYRNGSNWTYSLWGLLTLVFCAVLCGVSHGQRDLAEYAADLTQSQLRALGFRPDRKTRRISSPSETTFFRVLSNIDPSVLQAALLACMNSLLGPETDIEAIIIDGKALRSAQGVELVSAFSAATGRWLGTEMVEDKSNEIPAARRLLERADLQGTLVLFDALHSQTLTAREIVQDGGGDFLMTIKGNQKGLLETLRQIHSAHQTGAFPPSA